MALLSWLCRERGMTPEELLRGWSEEAAQHARQRFEGEVGRLPFESEVSLFQYVNFDDYAAVANRYRLEMEGLGVPPQNWCATLATLSGEGSQYRNPLAHGARFDLLPQEKRHRAIEVFQQTRSLLRS
ncbi:MAG: hypothetical protein ACRDJ9_01830, partial [Dehalococcoidia bacterium]